MINCGSTAILLTPIENIDNTPLKVEALTEAEEAMWSHLDLQLDTVPGMSINRAYNEIINHKKGETVTVAVIDSGIDIDHEDLQGSVWVNVDEIPGNNKDDDGNGYIDDIHGWNFLGDGYYEQYEFVRILVNEGIDNPDYRRAQEEYERKFRKYTVYKNYYEELLAQIDHSDETIKKHFKKSEYTKEDLKNIESNDENLQKHRAFLESFFDDDITTVDELRDALKHDLVSFNEHLDFHLNKQFNGRKTGDDPNDFSQRIYGNGNVKPSSSEESHGTHVAGIIAAVRNNDKGGNGVANNVKIMALRAVPNGDEYDKDVALAIRYAADNGATVINMSFGKYYSPHFEKVHKAIVYAAQKDVLIVSGAGNESIDLDESINYPNDYLQDMEISNNFISVGATNSKYGSGVVAKYSNYGKTKVDVFAPGSNILSTYPNNTYKSINGTSMASPAVAGLAALLRSYYPTLTASQVKDIILESGLRLTKKVTVPGDPSVVVPFGELSKSSRLINVYNAMVMASQSLNK
jgi:subtilisin family serine protease